MRSPVASTGDPPWEIANSLDATVEQTFNFDTDGDGLPDRGEYRLGFDPQDVGSNASVTQVYTEDFDGGSALPANWFVPADADNPWVVKSVTSFTAPNSLQSDLTSVGDDTTVVLPMVIDASVLNLRHFVSSNNTITLFECTIHRMVTM